ncbi:hypothetical protein ACFXA2_01495 [Micromonospora chalcea]
MEPWTEPKRDLWGGESLRDFKRRARGERAAWLRAAGRPWEEVAEEVGLASKGAAYNSAKRFGRPEHVARWPEGRAEP